MNLVLFDNWRPLEELQFKLLSDCLDHSATLWTTAKGSGLADIQIVTTLHKIRCLMNLKKKSIRFIFYGAVRSDRNGC